MLRVCAWCKKELGEVAPLDDKSVTHGICIDCKNDWTKEADKILLLSMLKEV